MAMGHVISATARYTLPAKGRGHLIARAEALLGQAREAYSAGKMGEAVEFAYQAALRAAGAWVADTSVGSRKRKPRGAWAQLELVGGEAAQWAQRFAADSARRSRLLSGIDHDPDRKWVEALVTDAERFYAHVAMDHMWGAAA